MNSKYVVINYKDKTVLFLIIIINKEPEKWSEVDTFFTFTTRNLKITGNNLCDTTFKKFLSNAFNNSEKPFIAETSILTTMYIVQQG